MNSVVRRSVNSGLTLIELVKKLDSKLAHIRHRGHEAEVSTVTTKSARVVNLTVLAKHAESIYTRGAYEFFYKELHLEPAYVVNDIDDDGGSIVRYQVNRHMYPNSSSIVEYNNIEVSYNCSCKLFERSGFLCRHILGVFKHTHVTKLPESSILPRWKRNVKLSTSNVGLDSFRKQIGVSLRLKDLEDNTHELFKWASQSVERFKKLEAHIVEFEISEFEKHPTSLGFEQILPDVPPGFEQPKVYTPEFVPQADKLQDPPCIKGKGRPKARKRKIWERRTIRCGLCGLEG
ncbi:Far1-related sequence like [Thalictrum thalictroides]|uniref:Protein FAR1-RELATED SEQUENCE n=1 Tax=Thalictrum thalictroides TaxID=46969 RepID=A0A7J6WI35_THATH|nr:Far1-related sequence like [Thalictrum thalictroides]